MFAVVYGLLVVLAWAVRFMEIGLHVCMSFILHSMAL